MTDTNIFHRPVYADGMAKQLLDPGPLDENLSSGVFFSGIRRIGKTTFVRRDLIPALLDRGALTLYVDLWTDRGRPPMALMQDAVREAVAELADAGSTLLKRLRRIKGANFGAAGISFGLQLDSIGTPGGVTLADAFVELVR